MNSARSGVYPRRNKPGGSPNVELLLGRPVVHNKSKPLPHDDEGEMRQRGKVARRPDAVLLGDRRRDAGVSLSRCLDEEGEPADAEAQQRSLADRKLSPASVRKGSEEDV